VNAAEDTKFTRPALFLSQKAFAAASGCSARCRQSLRRRAAGQCE